MSKREHNNIKDVPFSENLVFYAPLTQGDLTDHISGVEGIIPAQNHNCEITYDTSLEMTRINNRTSYYAGLFFDGLNMFPDAIPSQTLMRNIEKTIHYNIAVITNPNGNGYAAGFGIGGGDNGYNYNVSTGINRSVAEYQSPKKSPFNISSLSKIYNIVAVRKNLNYDSYMNKNNVYHLTSDAWSQYFYERFSKRVSLCFCPNGAGNIADFCISDVRIYNRALSASEVAQL